MNRDRLAETAPRMLDILEWMINEYINHSRKTGRDELTLTDEHMESVYRIVKAAGGHIDITAT